MCAPKVKVPKTPPSAQFQQVQVPKDLTRTKDNMKNRRRGMWSAIMTSPMGITAPPMTTGGTGGVTGA